MIASKNIYEWKKGREKFDNSLSRAVNSPYYNQMIKMYASYYVTSELCRTLSRADKNLNKQLQRVIER